MNRFLRYLIVNLCCAALGALLAVLWLDAAVVPALLFVVLVLWLCNETWNWFLAIPVLLTASWASVRGKLSLGKEELRLLRLTSLLLLAVPHVFFGVLFLADMLLAHGGSRWLGLELSHGLFACAYVAVVLLWMAAVRCVVAPLSLEILWAFFLDPEYFERRSHVEIQPDFSAAGKDQDGSGVSFFASQDAATDAEEVAPDHPQLRAIRGELLYYGRPDLRATTACVRKNVIVGSCLVVVVVLLLWVAVRVYPQSILWASLAGVLGVIMACVSLSELTLPARWNRKLREVEFAVTRTWVFIAEGGELCSLPLDKELRMQYEEVEGEIGTVYFDHPMAHTNPVGRLMAKIRFADVQHTADFSAPLRGFYQIARAQEVYALIRELQREL